LPAAPRSGETQSLVFVSYSHADARWLARLRVHLKPLERLGKIALWDDSYIKAGTSWRDEIRDALGRARVAVLLVTADFLASDFIASNELPPLLKAAKERGTLILPVIVKPCRFEKTAGLADFQAVNSPSRPLASLSSDRREELWVKLSGVIEDALTASVPNAIPPAEPVAADENPRRTRALVPAARTQADRGRTAKALARQHVLRYRFWERLLEFAKKRWLDLHAGRTPTSASWLGAGAGKTGYRWNYVIWMNHAAVELDIDVGDWHENKRAFDTLQQSKAAIEAAFGAALEWQRLDEKRRSGIRYIIRAGGLTTSEERWPWLQGDMIEAMARLSKVLQPYLLKLWAQSARETPAPPAHGVAVVAQGDGK